MNNEREYAETRDPAKLEQQRREGAVRTETNAMATAFNALQSLDHNARRRALRWLGEALENAEPPF